MTISRFYLKPSLSLRSRERGLFQTFDIWGLEGNEMKIVENFVLAKVEVDTRIFYHPGDLINAIWINHFFEKLCRCEKFVEGEVEAFCIEIKNLPGSEINHFTNGSVVEWKCSYWMKLRCLRKKRKKKISFYNCLTKGQRYFETLFQVEGNLFNFRGANYFKEY